MRAHLEGGRLGGGVTLLEDITDGPGVLLRNSEAGVRTRGYDCDTEVLGPPVPPLTLPVRPLLSVERTPLSEIISRCSLIIRPREKPSSEASGAQNLGAYHMGS